MDTEGKRMKLGDFFARKRAEAKADYAARLSYEATPEGRAEVAAREAHERRMVEADERFAREHPVVEEDDGGEEDDEGEDE